MKGLVVASVVYGAFIIGSAILGGGGSKSNSSLNQPQADRSKSEPADMPKAASPRHRSMRTPCPARRKREEEPFGALLLLRIRFPGELCLD